jgi:hypothetical protein
MNPDHTTFQLWLWGLVWTLGPWFALGFAAVLATFAIRKISGFARNIEKKPVEKGLSGFFAIVRDNWIHGTLTRSTIVVVIGCVMFGGFVAAGIQGVVHRNIQGTFQEFAEDNLVTQTEPVTISGEDGVLDLIILSGLIMACITVIIGINVYHRFRRHAIELAARSAARRAPRPIVVKLFYDNKAIGIVVLVVGCWIFWGFLCQIVGLAVFLFPGLTTLPSIPGVESAAIVFLVVLGSIMFAVMFAPFVWLSARNLKLQLRYLRENPVARRLFYVNAVVLCGLAGTLLNLYLIELLGHLLWPSVFDR